MTKQLVTFFSISVTNKKGKEIARGIVTSYSEITEWEREYSKYTVTSKRTHSIYR